MLSLSIGLTIVVIFGITFFVFTYIQYIFYKYYCHYSICYIEDTLYLLRYDIIDILISQCEDIEIDYNNLDTYGYYIEYLYTKYIKTITE